MRRLNKNRLRLTKDDGINNSSTGEYLLNAITDSVKYKKENRGFGEA